MCQALAATATDTPLLCAQIHTDVQRNIDVQRHTEKHRCAEKYTEIVQRNTDIQTYTYTPHSALAATATDTPHSCHTHAPALRSNILREKTKTNR